MTLYINACVRADSRTDRIARALLDKLGGGYTELFLDTEGLAPLTAETLDKRNRLIEAGKFDDPIFCYAHQFAEADVIVIAAPYWDMSFPAVLKTYIEHLCVMGIASTYDANGVPKGLCRASKLYYVTTAGGPYVPDFSYAQIEVLAKYYFGIPETELIRAEFLDIVGNDAEKIVADTIAKL